MGRPEATAGTSLSTAVSAQAPEQRRRRVHLGRVRKIPRELRNAPFTRSEALARGVSKSMLQGQRFVRVHPGVWRHVDHEMSHGDWIEAARLALPPTARTTGLTRLQQLGLDFGPRIPVRYVVEGDHHRAIDGVFLHRTKMMPPTDSVGVTPAAAFVACCVQLRVIDAIRIGDWLLHRDHMTVQSLRDLIVMQPWRHGASEAAWVMDHLDGDSRSLKESETRALISFAGLPRPKSNQVVTVSDTLTIMIDLWFEEWSCALEYEGGHHQTDRGQYIADIDRYTFMRRAQIDYRQVTKERLNAPRSLVRMVHQLRWTTATTDHRQISAITGRACSGGCQSSFDAGDAPCQSSGEPGRIFGARTRPSSPLAHPGPAGQQVGRLDTVPA
jgi:hypothetical protein